MEDTTSSELSSITISFIIVYSYSLLEYDHTIGHGQAHAGLMDNVVDHSNYSSNDVSCNS